MSGLKKTQKDYTRQFKIQIATEIVTGLKGVCECSRDYDLPRDAARRWSVKFRDEVIRRETKELLPSLPMENSKPVTEEELAKRVKNLEIENMELRKKLLEMELRTKALGTIIDLAEENYKIPFRKNFGAKQS